MDVGIGKRQKYVVMNSQVDDEIHFFSKKIKVIRGMVEITWFLNVMKCLEHCTDVSDTTSLRITTFHNCEGHLRIRLEIHAIEYN